MTGITRLSTADADFDRGLEKLLAWESVSDARVSDSVDRIIKAIRDDKDAALLELTRELDRWEPKTASDRSEIF